MVRVIVISDDKYKKATIGCAGTCAHTFDRVISLLRENIRYFAGGCFVDIAAMQNSNRASLDYDMTTRAHTHGSSC